MVEIPSSWYFEFKPAYKIEQTFLTSTFKMCQKAKIEIKAFESIYLIERSVSLRSETCSAKKPACSYSLSFDCKYLIYDLLYVCGKRKTYRFEKKIDFANLELRSNSNMMDQATWYLVQGIAHTLFLVQWRSQTSAPIKL